MQHIGQGWLSADQAAGLVHANTRKLSRQLAKLGTSISRELTRAKIEYAKEALTLSDRSIENIASALVYSDPSNFARAFGKEEDLGSGCIDFQCAA